MSTDSSNRVVVLVVLMVLVLVLLEHQACGVHMSLCRVLLEVRKSKLTPAQCSPHDTHSAHALARTSAVCCAHTVCSRMLT